MSNESAETVRSASGAGSPGAEARGKRGPIQLSDHFTYGRLMRFTLPSIATMIFTSVYGVVDGFFVSNFAGKTAFAAVNFIIPVLMILSTVGFMLGTGGTAIVSRTFGEGKPKLANEYFSLLVYFTLGAGVVLMAAGQIFIRPLAAALGADGQLLDDAVRYGRINLISLPFFMLQLQFQAFFSTAEKPKLGMVTAVAAGLTNMILDAVLVMALPMEHKLAGAAWATTMSEFVGGGVPFLYFLRKNNSTLRLGKTRFRGRVLAEACVNGSSEFMSNIAMSLVSMLFNIQLLKYAGENGVAAYGVIMYVSMIFSGSFIGYSVGTAPVVGYHYGAENREELRNLLKRSLRIISVFAVSMALLAELAAPLIARIFVGYDAELSRMTVSGFRIYAVSYLMMGFSIFGSGFFTALSDGLTSALISFLRSLVFECGCVLILPLFFGVRGVWFSIVAAECMAAVLTFAFLKKKQKRYGY